jgi:hypothetical protein
MTFMKQVFSRLFSLFSPGPPLATVSKPYAGATVKETLTSFEDACSEENFQNIQVLAQTRWRGGWLVRYEVRWKYSVFDDGPPSTHESWAWLIPNGAGYRVAKATREHHMPATFR